MNRPYTTIVTTLTLVAVTLTALGMIYTDARFRELNERITDIHACDTVTPNSDTPLTEQTP